MGAADPTYPLFPIARILAAIMLLLVLLTSFVRQNWNLGVTFLCFWLFLENLTDAVNSITWSDNADIRYDVYCDVVSHLSIITYVVKPMATLIITRRLYLIASLSSVDLPSNATRRWNSAVEWTLGLLVPLVVAGPIYYVHQGVRFEVNEVFGCTNSTERSILEFLTIESWTLIPPLISFIFYFPKVVWTFYRQSRDIHSFLNSNNSVSRTNYLRILALASVDIMLTLPIGVVNIVLSVASATTERALPFYWGWTTIHTDWEPVNASYAELQALGAATLAEVYFKQWTSPVLAFVIFGLFGATSETRASYWRIMCTIGGWVGWKPTPRTRKGQQSLGESEFGARPQDMSLDNVEMGSRRPSLVTPEAPITNESVDQTSGANMVRNPSSESIKEVLRSQTVNEAESDEHEHLAPVDRTSADAAINV